MIGFREPIYPLSVCGKSGSRSCTPPQMKVQTGIMEISKPWFSKETNTQSRNASKCFVLKIAQLLQSRFRPKHSWEGFDLSNQKALIYITARRQEKQETLCSEKRGLCHGWHRGRSMNFLFGRGKPLHRETIR